jgi:hypothetical protein
MPDQLIGLVHPKFADCYWEEYKMFHISIFLLTQYSFQQLITEPTYMTEHSSSLLDLVMVNNPTSVLYTEVGPPLLNQVRYHLPITGVLNHPIIIILGEKLLV